MSIPDSVLNSIARRCGVSSIQSTDTIQTLWGGYGTLFRAHLCQEQQKHADPESVIAKYIALPQPKYHPRGWNTSLSHQRKLDSYQVEVNWYQNYANQCHSQCYVPKCLHVEHFDNEILVVLEDLATAGFPRVLKEAEQAEINACLQWLAYFHAQHLAVEPQGLWACGTYWHLETRPDELKALSDVELKQSAGLIDRTLQHCRFQTLVHGDAKLANFCFSEAQDPVQAAAVDFQYVGRGCGMKDVILLLSSVLDFDSAEQVVPDFLDYYFQALEKALAECQPMLSVEERQAVEQEWRPIYCVAWADFQRFVKGWSPEHWKINPYTERLTRQALVQLGAVTERSVEKGKPNKGSEDATD
ncbi:choline kinase [Photobacterium jeanii]|uniref:Choline kinase n=1 Tax=Photobacterium jeanii TaxID=858640 RepID=A0A178K254_9GAMM|nr:phosphotransferase [Photobacterium jeanii]OAN11187.1 choline kinase [Photobacterium jeanii]PST90705.1 DUF1679 domain-containing protein [Photobacterium jeanii]